MRCPTALPPRPLHQRLPPKLRQSTQSHGAVQQLAIRILAEKKPVDICNSYLVRIALEHSDLRTFAQLPRLRHRKIEPGPAALHKAFDDVVALKLDRQLETRQPRLRDGKN